LLGGGDVLSVRHVEKCLHELRNCRLINGYGPTENTTFTCCYSMPDPKQVGHSISIGRPIANTQAYVLDGYLWPAPVGVPGELYLGGAGLARGYLNRPAVTAERFVPDPFGQPGERLYRTGDLVRWTRDGTLEFLGRIDQQVKIRGFRVEPGEIEAVLEQHPAVREAAVLARPDETGQARLIAYVVPRDETPALEVLRRHLQESLPDYMAPAAYVFLDALPLTAHGKLDRKSLPEPQAARPGLDSVYVAPRNETEETLAAIWRELLGLDRIGVSDNFFALGGHSLLATQVMSRVRERLQVDVPLRELFD